MGEPTGEDIAKRIRDGYYDQDRHTVEAAKRLAEMYLHLAQAFQIEICLPKDFELREKYKELEAETKKLRNEKSIDGDTWSSLQDVIAAGNDHVEKLQTIVKELLRRIEPEREQTTDAHQTLQEAFANYEKVTEKVLGGEPKRTISLYEQAFHDVAVVLGNKDMPVKDMPDAIADIIKKRDGWKARFGELLEQSPDEIDRQLLLLALAKLSLERPGFDYALNRFALKYDNGDKRAEMYDQFREMHKTDRTPEQWGALLRACVLLSRALRSELPEEERTNHVTQAQNAVLKALEPEEAPSEAPERLSWADIVKNTVSVEPLSIEDVLVVP